MRSLFLKIFLWFWATAIITGISLVLTFILQAGDIPSPWHAALTETASVTGRIVVEETERAGVHSASSYIDRLEQETHLRACIFDQAGEPLAGAYCATFQDVAAHVASSKTSYLRVRYGVARVAMPLRGNSGREYIFATELPAGLRAATGGNRGRLALTWAVAILVSGLICYLLTSYLTAPILRLREASQHLAAGEFGSRAAGIMERRRDELGDLVRDFNSMAERMEKLVLNQRQLIYDVSHELRSPLTRLNVALDLARERKGNDPAFDHMNQDLQQLDAMVGRLLTIAQLDTSLTPVHMSVVDLTKMLSEIVGDAQFESQERNCRVHFIAEEHYFVNGNAELLHSAIENVIRNAIRYTETGTSIEVKLSRTGNAGTAQALLSVRDHGPGVRDAELINIFRPFYRVTDARDRQSGGSGLGLAIAERVVRLHGGTIYAANIAPRGLQINIMFPINNDPQMPTSST